MDSGPDLAKDVYSLLFGLAVASALLTALVAISSDKPAQQFDALVLTVVSGSSPSAA